MDVIKTYYYLFISCLGKFIDGFDVEIGMDDLVAENFPYLMRWRVLTVIRVGFDERELVHVFPDVRACSLLDNGMIIT